jgi:acyl CoA:acetate/3-ketoacid CoA transferase alpha subunit
VAVVTVQVLAAAEEAVAGIHDGATVLIGGFGTAGQPMDSSMRCAGAACAISSW